MCEIMSRIGPHAPLADVKRAIIDNGTKALETDLIAFFTIDQSLGTIECECSAGVTPELQMTFLDMHGHQVTDRDLPGATIYNVSGTREAFNNAGIHTVVACPVRSQTGLCGALIAYYHSEIIETDDSMRLFEVIGSLISGIMSYAMTIDQSGQFLDDLAGANQKLEVQASVDGLTGLMNHRSLQLLLSGLCRSSSKSKKRDFSVVMIDVDHFKMYNDAHGHREGDAALREVAKLLPADLRQGDIAARYGGEEFVLVLRGVNKDTAFTVCDRIRRTIANHQFRKASLTISMGVAEFPADGSTPAEIIEYADRALYHAKITGRNRIVLWGKSTGSGSCDDNTAQTSNDRSPRTVLVIEQPDENGAGVIKEALASPSYIVDTVNNASAAIDMLRTQSFDILLLSIAALPDHDIKSLGPISAIHPDMPIVLIVEEPPDDVSCEALRNGASDILLKPLTPGELPVVVERNLERRRIECQRLADKSTTIMLQAIEALVAAIDAKDHHTVGHSQRVTALSLAIADKLEIAKEEQYALELAARLHDIGKIGLPDSALNKQSPLNEEEWAAMRQHPALGSQIVSSIDSLAYVSTVIRHHHERLDGTGYPDGLRGDAIPYLARIIAAADAYEAMTSKRAHRSHLAPKDAIEELRLHSGTYYDAGIVQALESHLIESGDVVQEISDQAAA